MRGAVRQADQPDHFGVMLPGSLQGCGIHENAIFRARLRRGRLGDNSGIEFREVPCVAIASSRALAIRPTLTRWPSWRVVCPSRAAASRTGYGSGGWVEWSNDGWAPGLGHPLRPPPLN